MLEQPQFPSDFRQKKRALSARPSHQETIFEMAHMVKLFAQLDPISITKKKHDPYIPMFEGHITLNPAEHIGHKVVPIAGCLSYHKPTVNLLD